MKYRFNDITSLIILTVLGAVLIGCGSSTIDLAKYEQQGYEIRTYEVFGMDCPGCHGGLEKLVNGIDGVSNSRANWEKQKLVVIIAPGAQVSDERIFEAVRRANFTPGKRLD